MKVASGHACGNLGRLSGSKPCGSATLQRPTRWLVKTSGLEAPARRGFWHAPTGIDAAQPFFQKRSLRAIAPPIDFPSAGVACFELSEKTWFWKGGIGGVIDSITMPAPRPE